MISLDVLTVASSLEVFRDNMLTKERYKQYPHFNDKKTHFIKYLDEIIEQQNERDPFIFVQFSAIDFLGSLVKHLDAQKINVDLLLQQWCEQLKKEHPDFSQLNEDIIRQHMKAFIKDEQSVKLMSMIFNLKEVQSNLEEGKVDHDSFGELMSLGYASILSYLVLGGCTLVLRAKEIIEDNKQGASNLRFLINKILKVEDSLPSRKVQLDSLSIFNQYLKTLKDLEPGLNVRCFSYKKKESLSQVVLEEEKLLEDEIDMQKKKDAQSAPCF
jgi:hypothetical protein